MVNLMNISEGTEFHIEMISRKEVLLRREDSENLSGGFEKLKSLKGVLTEDKDL
jgi:hypothetical protein